MVKQTPLEQTSAKRLPSQKKQSSSHTNSVNPLKSKIRDLERLLARSEHLPAGVQIEKERALAGYKQDLERAVHGKQRQHMISKYHKVRFFERQKASRALKKLQKQLADKTKSDQENQRLIASVQFAQVDVNYTIYYPLSEKYVSLFPLERRRSDQNGSQSPEAQESLESETQRERPPMWAIVEKCMEEGNLDQLREGRLRSQYSFTPMTTTPKVQNNPQKSEKLPDLDPKAKATTSHRAATIGDGNESDGGFFET